MGCMPASAVLRRVGAINTLLTPYQHPINTLLTPAPIDSLINSLLRSIIIMPYYLLMPPLLIAYPINYLVNRTSLIHID